MIPTFDIPPEEERNFHAAIREYYEATGKDAEYVVNRQALNVAIKTGMNTPQANAGAIRAVAEKEWWPKFVAKRLHRGSKVVLKGKTGKKYKGRRHIQGKYTREEAKAASKQMIKNRIAKSGYIRSGWLPAINKLSAMKLASKGRVGKTPSFTRNREKQPGDVVVARPGIHPLAELVNKADGAVEVAGPALIRGLSLAAADMRGFIAEKYGATAKKFSR